jgi:hypothetical protein
MLLSEVKKIGFRAVVDERRKRTGPGICPKLTPDVDRDTQNRSSQTTANTSKPIYISFHLVPCPEAFTAVHNHLALAQQPTARTSVLTSKIASSQLINRVQPALTTHKPQYLRMKKRTSNLPLRICANRHFRRRIG